MNFIEKIALLKAAKMLRLSGEEIAALEAKNDLPIFERWRMNPLTVGSPTSALGQELFSSLYEAVNPRPSPYKGARLFVSARTPKEKQIVLRKSQQRKLVDHAKRLSKVKAVGGLVAGATAIGGGDAIKGLSSLFGGDASSALAGIFGSQ